MKDHPHSQGWYELKKLSQQTHVDQNSPSGVTQFAHGMLIVFGFMSFIGIIAFFN